MSNTVVKEIKDYLHLYLGCEVMDLYSNRINVLTGVDNDHELPVKTLWQNKGRWALPYSEIKPILRRLSSMTEEELKIICGWPLQAHREVTGFRTTAKFAEISYRWPDSNMEHGWAYSSTALYFSKEEWTPEQFLYLLSNGFDLFGLIDSGLAMEKK